MWRIGYTLFFSAGQQRIIRETVLCRGANNRAEKVTAQLGAPRPTPLHQGKQVRCLRIGSKCVSFEIAM